MGFANRTGGARRWLAAAGLVLAVALSAELSHSLTNSGVGAAPIWTANAFIALGLLILPRTWAPGVVLSAFAVLVAATAHNDSLKPMALVFAGVNVMEAVLVAHLARIACGPTVRLTNLPRVARLLGFAVLPAAAVSALTAGLLQAGALGRPIGPYAVSWFAADALGLALILPPLLLTRRPMRDFERPWWEHLFIYALLAAATSVAFLYKATPLHFILFPIALFAAFRLGPRGAGFATLLLTAVTVGFITIIGGRGVNPGWSMAERIQAGQILVGAVFLSSLVTAMAVSDQARLKRLWVHRSALARRAEARAQAATRAKGEFLANMSHEIRTPMNSILGVTEVLLRDPDLPPHARRQLALIDQAGGSLLAVVNDILDYSKMEAGEIDLAPRPCAPRGLAEAAASIVADSARAKGLSLELALEGDVDAPVMVDDLRVRQVLLNLLSNAVKFTQEGGLRLTLSVTGDARRRLRFEVIDTGVGIEADKLDRLFKRFSQADGSVSRAYGGTGLGLAICKGLSERMGGDIGVDSTPGQGSRFWFEISADLVDSPLSAADGDGDEAVLTARILLVDDHPMNRELGATLLGVLGCEVALAESGEQAVALIRDRDFDLVFMDLHMPHMDGCQAARAIVALGGEPARTPIVALTADVMPETAETCRRAGMVEVAAKPIRLETLHDVVVRWSGLAADGERRAA